MLYCLQVKWSAVWKLEIVDSPQEFYFGCHGDVCKTRDLVDLVYRQLPSVYGTPWNLLEWSVQDSTNIQLPVYKERNLELAVH